MPRYSTTHASAPLALKKVKGCYRMAIRRQVLAHGPAVAPSPGWDDKMTRKEIACVT